VNAVYRNKIVTLQTLDYTPIGIILTKLNIFVLRQLQRNFIFCPVAIAKALYS